MKYTKKNRTYNSTNQIESLGFIYSLFTFILQYAFWIEITLSYIITLYFSFPFFRLGHWSDVKVRRFPKSIHTLARKHNLPEKLPVLWSKCQQTANCLDERGPPWWQMGERQIQVGPCSFGASSPIRMTYD